jgi:hypothetical protein
VITGISSRQNKIDSLSFWHAVAKLVNALRYKGNIAFSIPDGVIQIFH